MHMNCFCDMVGKCLTCSVNVGCETLFSWNYLLKGWGLHYIELRGMCCLTFTCPSYCKNAKVAPRDFAGFSAALAHIWRALPHRSKWCKTCHQVQHHPASPDLFIWNLNHLFRNGLPITFQVCTIKSKYESEGNQTIWCLCSILRIATELEKVQLFWSTTILAVHTTHCIYLNDDGLCSLCKFVLFYHYWIILIQFKVNQLHNMYGSSWKHFLFWLRYWYN